MKTLPKLLLLGATAVLAVGMATLRADKKEAAPASPDLSSLLSGKLVHLDGQGRLADFTFEEGKTPDFYGVYFSAHWCGPCRAFTPDLVRFYNEKKKEHGNFELIFVSSDYDEGAMRDYMKETGMAFPALKYDQRNTTRAITKFAGPGIPCLVILDAHGKVLAHSFEREQYLGPEVPLRQLDRMLESKKST